MRDKAKYFAIVALVALVDQLSKVWARQTLATPNPAFDPLNPDAAPRYLATEPIVLWRSPEQIWFELRYTTNPGAAWGIFSEHTSTLALLSAVMIVVIGWVLINAKREERLLSVALSLMLGGAFGNLLDRVAHGEVTDFFHAYLPIGGVMGWIADTLNWAALQRQVQETMANGIYDFPIFNVADSAVVVGTILLLLALMRGIPEPAVEPAPLPAADNTPEATPADAPRPYSSPMPPPIDPQTAAQPAPESIERPLGLQVDPAEADPLANGHADTLVLVDPGSDD